MKTIVVVGSTCLVYCGDALDAVGVDCCTLFSDAGDLEEKLKREAFEGALDEPKILEGATPEDIDDLIPDEWDREISRNERGIRYSDPARRGVQIIVYPQGNPQVSTEDVHGGPYAKVSDGRGQPIRVPLEGNPTLR